VRRWSGRKPDPSIEAVAAERSVVQGRTTREAPQAPSASEARLGRAREAMVGQEPDPSIEAVAAERSVVQGRTTREAPQAPSASEARLGRAREAMVGQEARSIA
jgi:hypothetical protein